MALIKNFKVQEKDEESTKVVNLFKPNWYDKAMLIIQNLNYSKLSRRSSASGSGFFPRKLTYISIGGSVFPFSKFDGSYVILGPEMKSTGEAMGIDYNFGKAFAKSQLSANIDLPLKGNLFVSVKNEDKQSVYQHVKNLKKLGFKISATKGTAKFLKQKNIECLLIKKVKEGSPNIVSFINEKKINLIFNTTEGASAIKDSFTLRRSAINNKVPYYTTMAGAKAVVEAIKELSNKNLEKSVVNLGLSIINQKK